MITKRGVQVRGRHNLFRPLCEEPSRNDLASEFEREGKRKEGQGPNEDPRTREECRALEAKARKRKKRTKGPRMILFIVIALFDRDLVRTWKGPCTRCAA